MRNVANDLIQSMRAEGLTLALAESITCGLAASRLSSCIGVSEVLMASLVCYTPEAKMQVLGVKAHTIDCYTCESSEVTEEMAERLAGKVDASIHAALTGLASADGSESKEKPVGTVFYAVRYRGATHTLRKVFQGTPSEVKLKAARELCAFILEVIRNKFVHGTKS